MQSGANNRRGQTRSDAINEYRVRRRNKTGTAIRRTSKRYPADKAIRGITATGFFIRIRR